MKKPTGLYLKRGIWQIHKTIQIGSEKIEISASTRTDDLRLAEAILAKLSQDATHQLLHGVRPAHTFREARERYLEDLRRKGVKSIDRARQHFNAVAFLDDLPLERIHQGTMDAWIDAQHGVRRSNTLKRIIAVVNGVLKAAATRYRDDDKAWLGTAPTIEAPKWDDVRAPYPLSWAEQDRLMELLPVHMQQKALFITHTGLRDQELCNLRWEWEVKVPELQTSIFVLPAPYTKNNEERAVVLNRQARILVEQQRGNGEEFVFPSPRGGKLHRMRNTSWTKAARAFGTDVRPHDLRHTFGRRLRAAGVPLETRKALMGHKSGDITTHYSAAELKELIDAVNSIERSDGQLLLRAVR